MPPFRRIAPTSLLLAQPPTGCSSTLGGCAACCRCGQSYPPPPLLPAKLWPVPHGQNLALPRLERSRLTSPPHLLRVLNWMRNPQFADAGSFRAGQEFTRPANCLTVPPSGSFPTLPDGYFCLTSGLPRTHRVFFDHLRPQQVRCWPPHLPPRWRLLGFIPNTFSQFQRLV